mgnify:CR=1 FL=1
MSKYLNRDIEIRKIDIARLGSLDINGNKASGTTYTIEVSTDIEERKSQIHGQYLDEFIKKGNKWFFLKRTFSILHD